MENYASPLQIFKHGKIEEWVFNVPETVNAINLELMEKLRKQIELTKKDENIKVIILRGAGKGFSSGGDIRAMGFRDLKQADEVMDLFNEVVQNLVTLPQIVIAQLHGIVAGAGISLALTADLIVAERESKFSFAFHKVGLIPDAGLNYFLLKSLGPWRVKELLWGERIITVEEMSSLGFVSHLVDVGKGLEFAFALAEKIANGPIFTFMKEKALLRNAQELTLSQTLELEKNAQIVMMNSLDHQEGITAFKEKRKPHFQGK